MKKPEDSSIVICSIVRNAEKGLRRNIPVINEVLCKFKDFRVVVYENDSVDGTKSVLKEWASLDKERIRVSLNDKDPEVVLPIVDMKSGVSPFFCHKRIDRMAGLRNNYMTWLWYLDTTDFNADYAIVVDLDVSRLDADAIMSSFADGVQEWDAVTSFGWSTSPKFFKKRYHDSYALTLWEDREKPQTEDMIVENAFRFGKLKADDEWVHVASAFGGLSIYRYEAIKGLKYTEPALENDDPRVEVKCEHYSLYKQMIERGYDRIYINPAMVLKYADLTLMTFWNSLHQSTFLDYYKRKLFG